MANKKYRLVIPEMIDKGKAFHADILSKYENEIIELIKDDPEGTIYKIPCGNFNGKIPKEWLQEIKQPRTAKEHYNNFINNIQDHDLLTSEAYFIQGYLRGEEAERLKHEPKEQFDSYFKNSLAEEAVSYGVAKAIWDDCEKNRGYDAE